jgi:hypothetical protein
MALEFAPTSAGAKSALLTVNGSNGAVTKSVSLSGTGGDTYTLSPRDLTFGNVQEAVLSISTVTLTNTGQVALSISSVALGGTNPGQFAVTSNGCPASLPVAQSCSIGVGFKPTTTGSFSALLNVTTGSGAGTQSVYLTGTGIVPTYTLSPTTLAFGNQAETVASAPQTITLTNTGTLVVPITSIALGGTNPGQFSQTSNCGSSVATSCTINVVFLPTSTGAKSATLTVTAGGGAAKSTVTLTGTGIVPTYSLSATSVAFGNQGVSVPSAPVLITLNNTGTVALPITSISVPAGQFSQTSGCPTVLAANTNCSIYVVFLPTSAGAKTATLTVKGGDGAATETVSLTGTGVVATYSVAPTTLAFGNQTHGTASAAKTVTVTNTGTVPLLISSVALAGGNPTQYSQTNNCGTSVSAPGTCTVNVVFDPTSTGSKPATLTITGGGGAGNKSVTLTGTGT